MNSKQAYNSLKEEFEQYKKESIKWGIEDFISRAEDIGYTITEEDAQNSLEDMIDNHDCNYGITWETLDYYIADKGYGTEKSKP